MFATIYGMNELSKKHLGTQENILCSLRFFYVYYFKKHKRTFDYDFYRSGYNISCFIRELDGFFTYLLGKQHLSDETDIISTGFLHSALSRTNKSTYGNHVRNVGRFLKYLNYRYMNLAYQDMSPVEAHQINQANHRDLADRIKVFNRVEVSRNEPAHRYKSITSQQSVELTNMLIPSTPEFSDIETGELFTAVVNPQNPFDSGVPLRYAKRFIEVVSNQSNYKRTKHSDMHLASPGTNISQTKTYNLLEDNVYDEDFTFKDLFN